MYWPEERLAMAKEPNTTEEQLFELTKSTYYNTFDMLVAIAENPNASARVISELVKKHCTMPEIIAIIVKRDMNRLELYDTIHDLDANMYDWSEEEWESVRSALVNGECAEKIQKDEALAHIITDKFPGPNPLYNQYWY